MEEEKNSNGGKIELIAMRSFSAWDDMYQIVDFLNKSLKDYNLMFGLKNGEKGSMCITIYEV
ncbi:MAG: YpmA family protein [Dehalobacterium sp.]